MEYEKIFEQRVQLFLDEENMTPAQAIELAFGEWNKVGEVLKKKLLKKFLGPKTQFEKVTGRAIDSASLDDLPELTKIFTGTKGYQQRITVMSAFFQLFIRVFGTAACDPAYDVARSECQNASYSQGISRGSGEKRETQKEIQRVS